MASKQVKLTGGSSFESNGSIVRMKAKRRNLRVRSGSGGPGFAKNLLGLRGMIGLLELCAFCRTGRRGFCLGLLFEANDILIRNFPAEIFRLAFLDKVLLEKHGAAGICHKRAGCGEENIASAVVHFHVTPDKRGITSHTVLSDRVG